MSIGGPPTMNFWAEVATVIILISATRVYLRYFGLLVFLAGAYSIVLYTAVAGKASEGAAQAGQAETAQLGCGLHLGVAIVGILGIRVCF